MSPACMFVLLSSGCSGSGDIHTPSFFDLSYYILQMKFWLSLLTFFYGYDIMVLLERSVFRESI